MMEIPIMWLSECGTGPLRVHTDPSRGDLNPTENASCRLPGCWRVDGEGLVGPPGFEPRTDRL